MANHNNNLAAAGLAFMDARAPIFRGGPSMFAATATAANGAGKTMKQKGLVSVLAIMFLAIFATMSLVFMESASTNVTCADNQSKILQARLSAESGMAYLSNVLENLPLSGSPSGQALLDAAAAALQAQLNGSANIGGQNVAYDGTTITIPQTTITGCCTFSAAVTLSPPVASSTALVLWVNGLQGQVTRSVGLNFNVTAGSSSIFSYGIATNGAMVMTGNASVTGKNSPSEANILSATYTTQTAFSLTGNVKIQGDLYAANPAATVSLSGNTSVGGVSGTSPGVAAHIHDGTSVPAFPAVDPTVFEPFATNIVNSSTKTSGNNTFTNIYIKAGTNPTFSGNTTLQGVVFIEQPNVVTFAGNTTLTGVIVTQAAPANTYTVNTISFTGNTTFNGVQNLPNASPFQVLRTMTGSSILAPGFGLSFTGNFGTVGGCMAADSFTFTGNAGGTICGGIINYSNAPFTLTGNSSIIINRSGTPATPPGFVVPSTVAPDPGNTYVESGGGF